jgi:hypothetical protein
MRAYHYTNPESFKSAISGEYYCEKGLIPLRRFISHGRGGKDIPSEAHDGVIEALLEPEPQSWLNPKNFPGEWRYLMHDVCRRDRVMLLSFNITQNDKAYVVERAHIERILHIPHKGIIRTRSEMNRACRKYWESRIPALEYAGGFELPQFAIWSKINPSRLNVEWVRDKVEFWKEVKTLTESQFRHSKIAI